MERTMRALAAFVLAEDPTTQKEAKAELVRFLEEPKPINDKKVEVAIRKVMLENGVPEFLKGYPFIIRAVKRVIDDRRHLDDMMGLYSTLASDFGCTHNTIERSISRVVEATFERFHYDQSPNGISSLSNPKSGKCTNGEFLGRIANLAKIELWK